MTVTSAETIAGLRKIRPEDADEVIARAPRSDAPGETLVIGEGGQLPATKGFTVSRLVLAAGASSAVTSSQRPEVVFVMRGAVEVAMPEATVTLAKADTFTVPTNLDRSYRALDEGCELVVVRGTA